MFGIIEPAEASAQLVDRRGEYLAHMRLEIKNPSRSRRWLIRLKKANVTCAAVDAALYDAIAPRLVKCGIRPVDGRELPPRLAAELALFSAEALSLRADTLGAEIIAAGRDVSHIVAELSQRMRYVAVFGCEGAVAASGVSVMCGKIPDGLCDVRMRISLAEGDRLLRVYMPGRTLSLGQIELALPEEYRGICGDGCVMSLAAALLQCGRLREKDITIKAAELI